MPRPVLDDRRTTLPGLAEDNRRPEDGGELVDDDPQYPAEAPAGVGRRGNDRTAGRVARRGPASARRGTPEGSTGDHGARRRRGSERRTPGRRAGYAPARRAWHGAPLPEVVEIRLDRPVEAHGATGDRVSRRRPRVADQLAAEKTHGGDGAREVALFASLCQVAPDTIRAFALSDYLERQRVFRDFLSRRRPNSAGPPGS